MHKLRSEKLSPRQVRQVFRLQNYVRTRNSLKQNTLQNWHADWWAIIYPLSSQCWLCTLRYLTKRTENVFIAIKAPTRVYYRTKKIARSSQALDSDVLSKMKNYLKADVLCKQALQQVWQTRNSIYFHSACGISKYFFFLAGVSRRWTAWYMARFLLAKCSRLCVNIPKRDIFISLIAYEGI